MSRHFRGLSIKLVALLFLSLHFAEAQPAIELALGAYKTDRAPYHTMAAAFKKAAKEREIDVKQLVANLQAEDPNYTDQIVIDEDFWKLSFLLDNGWDIAKKNRRGNNLLVYALAIGHDPNIDLILKFADTRQKRGGPELYTREQIPEILKEADQEGNGYYAQKLAEWKKVDSLPLLTEGTPNNFRFEGQTLRQKNAGRPNALMAPAAPGNTGDRFATVEVPYVTNREINPKYNGRWAEPEGADNYYSYRENAAGLQYGVATITIPKTHKPGVLEEKGILEFRLDPEKHVMVQRLALKTHDAFFADFKSRIETREFLFGNHRTLKESAKDIFVYTHGFNVDYSYAMRKTAQLIYDMDYPGTSVAFTWPARAVKLPLPGDFRDDLGRIERSYAHFENFYNKLRADFPGRKIHILAHSLGTRAVSVVLARMAAKRTPAEIANKTKLFGEVILAAPAIDAQKFKNEMASSLVEICDRVSIFASDDDVALKTQSIAEDILFPLGLWSDNRTAIYDGISHFDMSLLSSGTFSLDHSVYGDVVGPITQIARLLKFHPTTGGMEIDDPTRLLFLRKQNDRRDYFSPFGDKEYWKFFPI